MTSHSECSYCGGDMWVAYDTSDITGDHDTALEPCPVCVPDGDMDAVPEPIEDGYDTVRVPTVTMTDLIRGGRPTEVMAPLLVQALVRDSAVQS